MSAEEQLQQMVDQTIEMAIMNKEGFLSMHKQNGLVRDAFGEDDMIRLKGNAGVGHVRYPTAGSLSSIEAQPFYVNSPYGICLAHNGNLVNTDKLRKHLNTLNYEFFEETDNKAYELFLS